MTEFGSVVCSGLAPVPFACPECPLVRHGASNRALPPTPAAAYNVCSDPGEPCTNEEMASHGLDLLAQLGHGTEAANSRALLR